MNTQQIEGKLEQVGGKIKQSVGEAIGNDRMANSGAADQVKGDIKETWGNAKDAASKVRDDAAASVEARTGTASVDANRTYTTDERGYATSAPAEDSADRNVRDSVVGMANKVRDSINDGIDKMKHDK